ncbi:hypothetical protein WA026_017593, partial [Henosepilachna vigintioctopunctata]
SATRQPPIFKNSRKPPPSERKEKDRESEREICINGRCSFQSHAAVAMVKTDSRDLVSRVRPINSKRPPPGHSWTCLTLHPPAAAMLLPTPGAGVRRRVPEKRS